MEDDDDVVECELSIASPEPDFSNVDQSFAVSPSIAKGNENPRSNMDTSSSSLANEYLNQVELTTMGNAKVVSPETLKDILIRSIDEDFHEEDEDVDIGTAISLLAAEDNGNLLVPLQKLMLRVRKLGCIVDAVQVKSTRKKLKCCVDACSYRGPNPESIGFRCTLPSNIETAAQWICICVADVSRQNSILIKLINSLRNKEEERSQMMTVQTISAEKLLVFPFRICSRHFSTSTVDLSVPVMPNIHLPEKPMISNEELLPRLRRRYVFLSETGYEDIDIDKLEPNMALMSPFDNPISCDVPVIRCVFVFWKIYENVFHPIEQNLLYSVDYGRWRKAVQNGIGLPGTFELHLPEGGHVCEMHFVEGKRYTRGVMQDPSVFRKISAEGVSPTLSRLGPLCLTTCAVSICSNADVNTVCVPFPKQDDNLCTRWINALSLADGSFIYKDGLFICLRHFSLSHEEGLVPIICLGGGSKLDSAGDQHSLKRRFVDHISFEVERKTDRQENFEEIAKKYRIDSQGNGSDYRRNDTSEEFDQEKSCCVESRRIGETVEQIEMKARILERIVAQLQITCKNYYENSDGDSKHHQVLFKEIYAAEGEFNQFMKFQLYDILSELRSQKGIVHSLRQRLEDSVKDSEKLRWTID